MGNTTEYLEEILLQRGIRPTALRTLILREMLTADCALSQTDIETRLVTVDKSTVSRTLSLFVEHHLAHCFTGAESVMMYALCPPTCHCNDDKAPDMDDLHAHFVCQVCHKTYCLRNYPLPHPKVPAGFAVITSNLLLTGICSACNARNEERHVGRADTN